MRTLLRLFATTTRMGTIPLAEIPTLSLLYKLEKISDASEELAEGADSKYNDKISLIRHDITKLEIDAIVNAANESLRGGGGVDGAIHRAAGPALLQECRLLNGCKTGSAKITKGYNLPCKNVVHAVGPIYNASRKDVSASLLRGCYTTSLQLAVENNCRSIAFSALSTGIYGYPSRAAAKEAIGAVRNWLDEDSERAARIERIIFCQFLEKDESAYNEIIPFVRPLLCFVIQN